MKDQTYKYLWETLIKPTYETYATKYGGIICPESEYKEIKEYYDGQIAYAKKHYMANQDGLLNRHKISAALMIAILKAKPIKKISATYYMQNEDGKVPIWAFNESLAITVALSVLRCFIDARVIYAFSGKLISKPIFEDTCRQDSIIFKDKIPISTEERRNWEWEMYQIRQDGAYSLLSIAHILSALEKNARLEYFVNHKEDTPEYPDPSCLSSSAVPMLTIDQVFNTTTT